MILCPMSIICISSYNPNVLWYGITDVLGCFFASHEELLLEYYDSKHTTLQTSNRILTVWIVHQTLIFYCHLQYWPMQLHSITHQCCNDFINMSLHNGNQRWQFITMVNQLLHSCVSDYFVPLWANTRNVGYIRSILEHIEKS